MDEELKGMPENESTEDESAKNESTGNESIENESAKNESTGNESAGNESAENESTDIENPETEEEDEEEYKVKLLLFKILLGVGICMAAVAIFMLVNMITGYIKSKEIYDTVEEQYVSVKVPEDIGTQTSEEFMEAEREEGETGEIAWYDKVDVRISALQETYPDVMGWLWFEDGTISYPILYSGDNDKYLHTTYNGTYSIGGAIFLDGANNRSMFDPYNIIYGHNMSDGSMFGSLKNFKNSDYYEDHKYFQVITERYMIRYEIFAVNEVSCYSDLYDIPLKQDEQFETKLSTILLSSMLDSGKWGTHNPSLIGDDGKGIPLVSGTDFIVNLSTCTTHDARLFISAVQVDHHILK